MTAKKSPSSKPRLIGLTGNVACGKSTVARILREHKIPVIDADQIAREVMDPSTRFGKPGADKILAAFGTLDRAKLRGLAFSDPQKRKKLEEILHPLIRERSRALIDEAFAAGAPLAVYEAPLLIEAGRDLETDGLLVVTCSPETQLARMLARDAALSAETAEKIRSTQMSQDKKAARATWVVVNDGTEAELRKQVDQVLKQILSAAK